LLGKTASDSIFRVMGDNDISVSIISSRFQKEELAHRRLPIKLISAMIELEKELKMISIRKMSIKGVTDEVSG
jgi:aspartokinase/homoserine dehydrogenase 1